MMLPAGWTSMDCYSDNVGGRTLSYGAQVAGGANNMTSGNCLRACQQAGYNLAGTEYSGEVSLALTSGCGNCRLKFISATVITANRLVVDLHQMAMLNATCPVKETRPRSAEGQIDSTSTLTEARVHQRPKLPRRRLRPQLQQHQ